MARLDSEEPKLGNIAFDTPDKCQELLGDSAVDSQEES